MQPAALREGSPTTKPCANSEMYGTAREQPAAKKITIMGDSGKKIRAVSLLSSLIPQTISSEIQTHGGEISGITIKRIRQHVYLITLTKTKPET